MERGWLWLPLLVVFVGLAWAGWHEYHQVQSYQQWAKTFERSKYDIYAVLGQKGDRLTWGMPTRSGPVNLQTLESSEIEQIQVRSLSPGKSTLLILVLKAGKETVEIPFTDAQLAQAWGNYLQQEWLSQRQENFPREGEDT